jgi:glutamate formiminotransferase/formiminotetrahydrofolate cyclodeaminase
MKPLLECVPNISEGRDDRVISEISRAVETVAGVRLLDVNSGQATNRTVITFVGPPQPVVDAAFLLIEKASQLIDMRRHRGEHPRFGATDVCPLIPIAGISMEEAAAFARQLGKRVGAELNIPVYYYEYAATEEKRRNLANIRAGQYEGLTDKLRDPAWKPDEGPAAFNARSGAIAISARNFLIAYNVNLNTTSVRRANSVAFDVREAGRVETKGGRTVLDKTGQPVRTPGVLKAVKAIGWFIEEYGICQISMNLTNPDITSIHQAFEATCESAQRRGMRVTGSELVGLVPKKALLDAAEYFLRKQQRSLGVSDSEKIKIAVKSLGLDDLAPFDARQRVIEYRMEDADAKRLTNLSLESFADETASESMAPGGGSVSAYVAALGVSLGTMVANLSSHKRGWDDRWEEFSAWAVRGQRCKKELLSLVDLDTQAFNRIIDAIRLPQTSEQETSIRKAAIDEATRNAIEVPFRVMQLALDSMEVMRKMVEIGNPASASDAGVGALCARAAIRGAFLNVRTNAVQLDDPTYVAAKLTAGQAILDRAAELESETIKLAERQFAS